MTVWESALLHGIISIRREREAAASWEKRRSVEECRRVLLDHVHEFREDAPDTPDVDSCSVVFLEKNQLRSTVPTSHDVSRQLALSCFRSKRLFFREFRTTTCARTCSDRCCLLRTHLRRAVATLIVDMSTFNAFNRSSETEIANLNRAIFVDEYVSWLEISVEDFSRVEVLDTSENVVRECLDLYQDKVDGAFEEFLEIGLAVFRDDVERIEGIIVLWFDDFIDADQVLVV